jgi:hypothetical protein
MNTRLVAIATHQSGTAAPSTTYPYQFWADTTNGLLKQRDGANAAFVTVGTLGVANLGLATLASPTFTGTPAAPTAAAGTNTTQLATTAFVTSYAMPVLGTSQSASSNTSFSFSSIPSWTKKITLIFNGISTNGTSLPRIRLGTGGTLATSGYDSASSALGTSTIASTSSNGGFDLYSNSASYLITGIISFTNPTGNTWVGSGVLHYGASVLSGTMTISGVVSLSGTLNLLTLTTVNGTDTFDAGSINILYE